MCNPEDIEENNDGKAYVTQQHLKPSPTAAALGVEGERGEKGRQFYSRRALRCRDMRLFVAQCGGNDGAVRGSCLAAISG